MQLKEHAGFDPSLVERLEYLDRVRRERTSVRAVAVDDTAKTDADVIMAGGGLWSLLAPILAARGRSVIIVERARAGDAHREWNASARELEALVRTGIVTPAELDALIVSRYDHGICSFHGGGGPYPVHGVLDCAVDAQGLLTHARRLGERLGVRYLDGHTVRGEGSSRTRVAVDLGDTSLVSRILVDARGSSSPYARADLVCPTVGGVFEGLAFDPRVGDILRTIDGIDADGRQHVWEAFPGRNGELTVYVFMYAHATEPLSLAKLYERFFTDLPRYRSGTPKLLRPTFGYIPGWSRLSAPPAAPADSRIVLVGDAAARHSPLTYCGFGATLRSLEGAADAIERTIDRPGPAPACIVDDASVHRLTGAFAELLASRRFRGNTLNALLDAAFGTLHSMDEGYARLLRDEMTPRELARFLRKMAGRHPAVWGQVISGLGIGGASRWAFSVARSMTDAV